MSARIRVAAFLCALFLALALARVLHWGPLDAFDVNVAHILSYTAYPSLTRAGTTITHAGSSLFCLPFLALVAYVVFRERRTCIIIILASMLGAIALTNVFKVACSLPRPPDPIGFYRGYGFPSGHTANQLYATVL